MLQKASLCLDATGDVACLYVCVSALCYLYEHCSTEGQFSPYAYYRSHELRSFGDSDCRDSSLLSNIMKLEDPSSICDARSAKIDIWKNS